MALPLSITLNVAGEASAKEYRYSPGMSIFGSKTQDKDNGKTNIPRQLFVPYSVRITRADVVKAGEFSDPKNVTSPDLLRVLGSEPNAVRVLDYAESRSGDQGVGLDVSSKSGLLKENINTVVQLAFKDGSKIELQSEVYTIYSSKLVSWKLNPKSSYTNASISAVVDISVVRGTQIGTLKRQRLKCPGRREALRESIKEVFKKDLLGTPPKRPSNVVSRRLLQAMRPPSSSRGSRYLSNEDRRRLRLLYPNDPRYAPTSRRTVSRASRRGGKPRKPRKTRTTKRTTNNYVLRTWVI